MTSFWLNDPTVLLNIHSFHDFWIMEGMSKNEKFNAITRLLLLIIVVFYISNRSIKFLCIGLTTLCMVTLVYYVSSKDQESFVSSSNICNKSKTTSTVDNPMSNLLLPEIQYDPNKKESGPAFGKKHTNEIEENVKDLTCQLSFKDENSDEIKKKLFSNVGEQLLFDRSMTHFYTNSANQVPNDRESYQEFLYGNMPSCKDQDPLACLKQNFRHIPHI